MDEEVMATNEAVRRLEAHGIVSPVFVTLLASMMLTGAQYRQVLLSWAEYNAGVYPWSVERWHSELCRTLLRCGWEIGPEQFLTVLVSGGQVDNTFRSTAVLT